MNSGLERLIKAMEFERKRSRRLVPLSKAAAKLLGEDSPFFKSHNGPNYPVKKEDLHEVISTLGRDELGKLRLPMYLKPAPSLGHGFYELLGAETGSDLERIQLRIVFHLLGTGVRPYLYGYEVQRLKRRIPSLIHVFY